MITKENVVSNDVSITMPAGHMLKGESFTFKDITHNHCAIEIFDGETAMWINSIELDALEYALKRVRAIQAAMVGVK